MTMAYPRTSEISTIIFLGSLACLLVSRLIVRSGRIPKGFRLPPGPRRKFIFGNAADMPTHHEWETFSRWAEEYGDIVYAEVLRTSIIIVNSADTAFELFERRSGIYSDRFDFPMMNDLMGFDWSFGLMHYGERWRRHRKIFHQEFKSASVARYHNIQTQQTLFLLRQLHATPDDFAKHVGHLAGATILKVAYGFDVLPGDHYIETAEKAMAAMAEAGIPGAFLVDTIPILKYVPEWMIGAEFQRKAREVRLLNQEMTDAPFSMVKSNLRAGAENPSVLVSLLERLDTVPNPPPDEEEVIRNAAAVAYFGGTDTTTSALTKFILAMLVYPETQRKAQAELDSVVGTGRLPEFDDRKSLPYINALCNEVLRWHPVLPLGVAHRLMEDDVYGNYFLPKGSVVIGNSWAMLHDEQNFGSEPEKFRPERFLDPKVKYPISTFGFGRRICPGRHLADNSIFIAVASILAVFDIVPAKDTNGQDITVEPLFTSGFLSYAEPFRCLIKPRSDSARALLSE